MNSRTGTSYLSIQPAHQSGTGCDVAIVLLCFPVLTAGEIPRVGNWIPSVCRNGFYLGATEYRRRGTHGHNKMHGVLQAVSVSTEDQSARKRRKNRLFSRHLHVGRRQSPEIDSRTSSAYFDRNGLRVCPSKSTPSFPMVGSRESERSLGRQGTAT